MLNQGPFSLEGFSHFLHVPWIFLDSWSVFEVLFDLFDHVLRHCFELFHGMAVTMRLVRADLLPFTIVIKHFNINSYLISLWFQFVDIEGYEVKLQLFAVRFLQF